MTLRFIARRDVRVGRRSSPAKRVYGHKPVSRVQIPLSPPSQSVRKPRSPLRSAGLFLSSLSVMKRRRRQRFAGDAVFRWYFCWYLFQRLSSGTSRYQQEVSMPPTNSKIKTRHGRARKKEAPDPGRERERRSRRRRGRRPLRLFLYARLLAPVPPWGMAASSLFPVHATSCQEEKNAPS